MEKVLSSVIPSLVKEGFFGNVEYKELRSENDTDVGPHYGSSLTFINLVVKNNSGEVIIPLLIKTPILNRPKDGPWQFMMESLMYKEVLPSFDCKEGFLPKLYYSRVSLNCPEENVLIFGNLKYKQYCNSKSRTFLDFDHISLALKTIAKFHSLSFILKHENPEKFLELTKKIKQYSFDPKVYAVYNRPIYAAIERGITAFERKNGPNEVLEDLLRALKDPAFLRGLLSEPEEPFDVICHGDFCNNNVMYKYNERGSPTDCILCDFQLSIYGNIAVELAFFLYMHTDSDCREKYWDSFMKIYWDTLRESVPEHIELPSHEDLLEYFGPRSMIGYTIGSFFLPMVMVPNAEFFGNFPVEEQVALMKTMAGDEGEKAIVNILSHMYNKKYIHKFLKFMETKKC